MGGINTYGYALQNPIMYYDPNGRVPIVAPAILCVVGASVTLAGGLENASIPSLALGCAAGVLSLAGTSLSGAVAVASRIAAGFSATAAGGLVGVSDVMAIEPAAVPLPNYGSPDPVDESIQHQFCLQNPDAPNCQEEVNSCE